jgi:hypothetical protein
MVTVMKLRSAIFRLGLAIVFTGCAITPAPPKQAGQLAAAVHLKEARVKTLPAQERVALYLKSAAEARNQIDSPTSGEVARQIYNEATDDLTVLLHSADDDRLWNRPQTFPSGHAAPYHLRFASKSRNGIWDPGYFTSFTRAEKVASGSIRRKNQQDGIGAALVGVRKKDPPHP